MHLNAEIEFFQVTVLATLDQVYRSFTRGVGLQEWLSNGARTMPLVGGMVTMWWNKGYYMVGEFTRLEVNSSVAFTWHGRGEPKSSLVQVQLTEENGAVRVEVTHQGLGSEEIWIESRKEIRKGWEQGLENLKSVLETGRDLRVVNRPGMGIYPAEVSADLIAQFGFPVDKGIFLKQVIENLGANKAGLMKDDLVVEMDGAAVTTIESLFQILGKQSLGNVVNVTFYRGPEKKTTQLELMRLPVPEIPETYQDFVDKLDAMYNVGFQNLRAAVTPVPDDVASWKPAPEEWSIKEALAHLIHNERDNQYWLHSKVLDEEFGWLDNSNERGQATLAAYPTVEELLSEFKRAQMETLAFVKILADLLKSRKNTYWTVAQSVLTADEHIKEHIEQIHQNLRAYKSSHPS